MRPPAPRGQVVGDGNGVEVARDDDAGRPAEPGPGHDGVAVAAHLEMRAPVEGVPDSVRESPFVAAHRLDVDDVAEQLDEVSRSAKGAVATMVAAYRRAC